MKLPISFPSRAVRILAVPFALLLATHAPSAQAAALTWSGTTDGLWSVGGVGGNWTGAAAPGRGRHAHLHRHDEYFDQERPHRSHRRHRHRHV